ncbi:zinc finger protein [Trifolium repens]|nr:zinc finger protein [Trifolium repens]
MGGKCPHRKVKKRRLSNKQDRRSRFLIKGDDMVYDQVNKPEEERKPLPVDEDLPGMGQHYCLHCDRFFASVAVRDEHFKTKKHRRRYVSFSFQFSSFRSYLTFSLYLYWRRLIILVVLLLSFEAIPVFKCILLYELIIKQLDMNISFFPIGM